MSPCCSRTGPLARPDAPVPRWPPANVGRPRPPKRRGGMEMEVVWDGVEIMMKVEMK